MKIWKFGVVGTGYIAGQFAKGMRAVENAEIAAVVSRSEENGGRYAAEYDIKEVYTDLTRMLEEVRPDVVYIATPNDCHFDAIMTALGKGIPVLSEKPTVDNLTQLEKVLALAEEKDLFFMEGMWTRCFPAVLQARKWIEEGRIGDLLTVKAFFDIAPAMEDWQPWKGGIVHAGGSLRDVGIYSLAMANLAFPGRPERICSTMRSNGEVDSSFRMLMDYGGGRSALVGGAFDQLSSPETEIIGTLGKITLGPQMWHPKKAVLTCNDFSEEEFTDDYPETGFQYEIRSVIEALDNNEKECRHYTWQEMKDIAAIIEDARKEWGIIYAADKE